MICEPLIHPYSSILIHTHPYSTFVNRHFAKVSKHTQGFIIRHFAILIFSYLCKSTICKVEYGWVPYLISAFHTQPKLLTHHRNLSWFASEKTPILSMDNRTQLKNYLALIQLTTSTTFFLSILIHTQNLKNIYNNNNNNVIKPREKWWKIIHTHLSTDKILSILNL